MITLKRITFSLALSLFALALDIRAQTPQVSTVNISPDEQQVRVSAVGDVLDMRVVVSDEAGDVVFESSPVVGDELDWALTDSQGRRVAAGNYSLTVTYRTSAGKLRRRVEQVLVTGEATGGARPESAAAAPTPSAPVEGAGTAGRISKFTSAGQIGNSVLFESAGRLGLGTFAPAQSIHVFGAASRLRLQSTNTPSLTTTEFQTNNRLWQVGAGGSTAPNGVANKFFVYDQTANQYRLVIDPTGNVGVGTTTPAAKLAINGQLQLLGANGGIKFPDGSIQTKAIGGTITGTGTTNRLAKFTGPNSFGNSVITEINSNVGIGTTNPSSGKLQVESDGGLTAVFGRSVTGTGVWGYSITGYGVHGYSDRGFGVIGSSADGFAGEFNGRVRISKDLSFGSNTRQLINLSGTGYGIGVQPHTHYFRSDNSFAWYRGGVHSNTALDPGGGTFTMHLDSGGNLFTDGAMTPGSDRNMKANISLIDPRSILARVVALPIHAWNYKADQPTVRHIGPMAQDFSAAFGVGADDKHIATVDADGVALASIQALYELMLEKDRQNEQLALEVRQLRAQMSRQQSQLQQQQVQLNQVKRAVKLRRARVRAR